MSALFPLRLQLGDAYWLFFSGFGVRMVALSICTPWVDGSGGGCSTGPWVACSSRSWGSFRNGESMWVFGQSSGVFELSSSDPQ